MSTFLKNILLLTAALLSLAGGYWFAQYLRVPESVTTPQDGGNAVQEFALPDLEGKTRRLSEWRGKIIVLNFWASWCPPCREEIPFFIALQNQLGTKGLQVVGVAIDRLDAVLDYRKSAGMNYPSLIGDDDAMQIMTRFGNTSGSLPFTAIIDTNGRVIARKLGAFQRQELTNLIEPLLHTKNSASNL